MGNCKKCNSISIEQCDSELCPFELPAKCVKVPAIECLGNIDRVNLESLLESICNLLPPNYYTFQNGLTETLGVVELGGDLIHDTNITLNNYNYRLISNHADYFSGNNGIFNVSAMQKEVSANDTIYNGILDLSSFGLDNGTVFLGKFDSSLSTATTNMYLTPTLGNIRLYSTNNTDINSENNLDITTTNILNTTSNTIWQGGVDALNGGITAGIRKVDFIFEPYATLPKAGFELKNNQNYATGFFTLHDVGNKFYSNMFYGTLDVNNIITDLSRVETADVGTSGLFIYDKPNNYENEWILDSNGFRVQNNAASGLHTLAMSNDGQVNLSTVNYFADDTAAALGGLVTGDLYQTDGTGAAPLNIVGILMIKQ